MSAPVPPTSSPHAPLTRSAAVSNLNLATKIQGQQAGSPLIKTRGQGLRDLNNPIMSHAEWMRRTYITIGRRNSALAAIDLALLNYEKTPKDKTYSKNWFGNDIRDAFDKYTRQDPHWESSERNRQHAFTDLDMQLDMAGFEQPCRDSEMATNLREGTLFFLSRLTVSSALGDIASFVNNAIDTSSDVADVRETVRKYNGVSGTADAAKSASKNGEGFLGQLVESLAAFVKDLAEQAWDNRGYYGDKAAAFLKEGVVWLIANMGDVVKKILGALVSQLNAVYEVGKNLYAAGKAARAVFASRHLEDGVLSGQPLLIVNSVRDQIKHTSLVGAAEAVKSTLLGGVSLVNPVVGTVASAIVSVFFFIKDLVERLRTYGKMRFLIDDSRTQYLAGLHRDPKRFQRWFLGAIASMPLVASYLICSPMTGSYYGFLTLASTDGTQISAEALARNYGEFNDVKVWAKQFIQADKLTLDSPDVLVKASLNAALGKQNCPIKECTVDRGLKTVLSTVKSLATG